MSTAEANELTVVLDHIRSWPSAQRIALARRILEGLEYPHAEDRERGALQSRTARRACGTSPRNAQDRP